MELVYLWVEDYKNIKKQGFNFSSRFKCEYDEEKNELTIDENKDYVSIFPNNINVTAIVGENGSGKSSVFEILSLYHYQGFIDEKSFLFYFKEGSFHIINDKVKIIGCNQKTLKQFLSFNNNTRIKSPDIFSPRGPVEFQMSLITNDLCDFTDNKKFNDLKTYSQFYNGNGIDGRLKYHYADKNIEDFNEKFFYLLKIDNTIFDFLGETFIFNKYFFEINGLLLGHDIVENYRVSELIDFSDENKRLFDNCIELDNKNYLLRFTLLVLLINTDNLSKEDQKKIYDEFHKEKFTMDSAKFIIQLCKLKDDLENIFKVENIEFILSLFYLIKSEKDYWQTDMLEINNSKFSLSYFFENPLLNFLLKEGYLKCNFAHDKKNHKYSDFSSGEKEYLKILTNGTFIIETINNHKSVILLDEPDIALHPNWQKKLLNNFVTIYLRLKSTKNIHFLLNSHSPFILSDLPKENVIFLDKFDDKDEEVIEKKQNIGNCKNVSNHLDIKQTFGANIHTLLSHGFFMKDGLMGEFAKEKINDVIKNLKDKSFNPLQEEKEKILATIKIIGEDFLRIKLLDMYYKKFNDDFIKEQRKEELEELQEKIKQELENL